MAYSGAAIDWSAALEITCSVETEPDDALLEAIVREKAVDYLEHWEPDVARLEELMAQRG